MNNVLETTEQERRQNLERQANAIGYDLNYTPEVQMEDITLLPDSFWHECRTKGWGGSNEGVLNGISKFGSLPELVNEKLLNKKLPVDADKQYMFDFGHALEWVMLKRYAAENGYKFLTYTDYFVIVRSYDDVSKTDRHFKKAMEGIWSFKTRDKEEADALLASIGSTYPNSFIAEQESNDPKDERDITPEEHAKYDDIGIVCVDRRQYINPNYPSMFGDCDGLCLPPDGTRRGLECKTYTHNAPKGSFASGVLGQSGAVKNEEYRYQVEHYMATCNLDRFDIIATCGNSSESDFTITTVYRDVDFEKRICENAQKSWEKYIDNLEQPTVSELSENQHESLIESITPEKLDIQPIEISGIYQENLEKIEKAKERLKELESEKKLINEQIAAWQYPIESEMAENTSGFMVTNSSDYDYQIEFDIGATKENPWTIAKKMKASYPDVWEKYHGDSTPKRKFSFFRTKKKA